MDGLFVAVRVSIRSHTKVSGTDQHEFDTTRLVHKPVLSLDSGVALLAELFKFGILINTATEDSEHCICWRVRFASLLQSIEKWLSTEVQQFIQAALRQSQICLGQIAGQHRSKERFAVGSVQVQRQQRGLLPPTVGHLFGQELAFPSLTAYSAARYS